jgi:small subunit ribosomal protein S2
MKALLESGVHFGHRTNKWDPAMKPYIFTERNNIHIIDLQKTVKALEEAHNLVAESVAAGGTVLFVGTKRQAQETIMDEAERCEMPWVTHKWLGGTLTNWRTIRQRVNELERLERMREKGDFERLPKKEALLLSRKIDRLDMLFSGIRSMASVPDLLFVVDIRREETAIHEANLLNIPVVAMVDTNCNPNTIDYVIPSNDDAIRAIKLIVGKMADAVLEGKAMRKEEEVETTPRVMRVDMEEEELADEELLGAATLAKLASSTDEQEAAVEAPVEDQEVEVDADSDVAPETESVEEASSTEEAEPADAPQDDETADTKDEETDVEADEQEEAVEAPVEDQEAEVDVDLDVAPEAETVEEASSTEEAEPADAPQDDETADAEDEETGVEAEEQTEEEDEE